MRVLASHLWIVAVLLSVVMISCGREEPEEQKKPEDFDVNEWENTDIDGDATMSENTIQFCVGDSANVMRAATAFDGTGYTFSVDDIITIEMYRGSTKVGTKKYKVKDTSGTLEFADTGLPFAWESKSETVKLRAWSYGNTTALTTEPVGNTFKLNTTQTEITTGQAGKDNYQELLYSPQQSYGYSASLNLRLYHQMARLTVTLTHSKTEDLSVTSITFGDGTLPVSAKFSETGIDIASSVFVGSWKDLENGDGSTGTVTPRADVANEKYSAVLFPGTIAKDKRLITLTTADGTFAYKLPSAITLQAGKQYDYKINVKDLVPVSELTISDIAAVTYTGSAHEPHPTVTYGSKTLEEGTHYTLSWSNNTNAGTATCIVTGTGKVFTGTKSKNFTINKAESSVPTAPSITTGLGYSTYTGAIQTLLSSAGTASGGTLMYQAKATNSTPTIGASGWSTTIPTALVAGTYYVWYYVSGDANHNNTSVLGPLTVNVSATRSYDIKQNPLWYMAPYNMTGDNTIASTISAGYYYKWVTSMTKWAAGGTTSYYFNYRTASKSITGQSGTWHLPVIGEWESIIPTSGTELASNVKSYVSEDNQSAYKSAYLTPIFGYNTSTKAGVSESSYFRYVSENEIHAIRFLGTQYCSAWKYVLTASAIYIYATLIDVVANNRSAAESWYNNHSWNGTGEHVITFGNNEAYYAIHRTLGNCGHRENTEGAANDIAGNACYWSASSNGNQYWRVYCNANQLGFYGSNNGHGFTVRLFRDN